MCEKNLTRERISIMKQKWDESEMQILKSRSPLTNMRGIEGLNRSVLQIYYR